MSPWHPLDDSRELVSTAWERFNRLDADMAEVMQDPQFLPRKQYVDASLYNVLEIPVIPVLPPRWGTLFAEVGNACRSALDYLVYELVVEAGGNPEREKTTFPIATNRDEYWQLNKRGVSYRDRCLAGVDEVWKKKIDDLQPYNRLQTPERHPLARLNRLSNRQKHRKPHVPFLTVLTPAHSISFDTREEVLGFLARYRGNEMQIGSSLKSPRRVMDNMMGIRVYQKTNPDGEVGATVTFGEERMGTGVLKEILEYVEQVLVWFEPAFEPAAK